MQTVQFEIHAGIAVITLNRPERGNAIDLRMARELLSAASRCSDSSVRVVLLRGAGRHCMTPDTGTTYTLPAIVGRRRALELLLTNRRLSAAEALDWGLVTKVVADEELVEAADSLAAQLATGPLHAYGTTKRLIAAAVPGLEAQMALESHAIARQRISDEGKEGIEAYTQKRAPDFVGAVDHGPQRR